MGRATSKKPAAKNSSSAKASRNKDEESASNGDLSNESDSSGDESVDSGGDLGSGKSQNWVQCDKCTQWRRLSKVTDLKTLPKRWFCSMNPDPKYNDCSIPQEDDTEDPEQRLRTHLRLWVRRIKAGEDAETRLPTSHATRGKKRPLCEQEWIQCCDPNCGKWRALHRSMDVHSLLEKHTEWYCVMNSWDEALASCAAPQEIPTERVLRIIAAQNSRGKDEEDGDGRPRKTSRR